MDTQEDYGNMKNSRELVKRDIEEFYNGDFRDYHARNYLSSGPYAPLKYRQLYIENMIDNSHLPRNARILDVGCGPGELILKLLKKGYDAWGVDISPGMIREASETVHGNGFPEWSQGQVGDIEKLDFKDNSFDVVVASGVIEYQKDDTNALSEMNRVLKKDGFLILNVTNRYSYVSMLGGLYAQIKRNRTTRWLLEILKSKLLRRGRVGEKRIHPERRVHSPKGFDRQIEASGFQKISHNYFHFALLPSPLNQFASSVNSSAAKRLEALLSQSRLGFLGGGYLVLARKVSNVQQRLH